MKSWLCLLLVSAISAETVQEIYHSLETVGELQLDHPLEHNEGLKLFLACSFLEMVAAIAIIRVSLSCSQSFQTRADNSDYLRHVEDPVQPNRAEAFTNIRKLFMMFGWVDGYLTAFALGEVTMSADASMLHATRMGWLRLNLFFFLDTVVALIISRMSAANAKVKNLQQTRADSDCDRDLHMYWWSRISLVLHVVSMAVWAHFRFSMIRSPLVVVLFVLLMALRCLKFIPMVKLKDSMAAVVEKQDDCQLITNFCRADDLEESCLTKNLRRCSAILIVVSLCSVIMVMAVFTLAWSEDMGGSVDDSDIMQQPKFTTTDHEIGNFQGGNLALAGLPENQAGYELWTAMWDGGTSNDSTWFMYMQDNQDGNVRAWQGNPSLQGNWLFTKNDDESYRLSTSKWPTTYLYLQNTDDGNACGWVDADPGPQGNFFATYNTVQDCWFFSVKAWSQDWYLYMQGSTDGNVRGWEGNPGDQGCWKMAPAVLATTLPPPKSVQVSQGDFVYYCSNKCRKNEVGRVPVGTKLADTGKGALGGLGAGGAVCMGIASAGAAETAGASLLFGVGCAAILGGGAATGATLGLLSSVHGEECLSVCGGEAVSSFVRESLWCGKCEAV